MVKIPFLLESGCGSECVSTTLGDNPIVTKALYHAYKSVSVSIVAQMSLKNLLPAIQLHLLSGFLHVDTPVEKSWR